MAGRPKKIKTTYCNCPGCSKEAHARGLCKTHYNLTRTNRGREHLKKLGYDLNMFKRTNKQYKK